MGSFSGMPALHFATLLAMQQVMCNTLFTGCQRLAEGGQLEWGSSPSRDQASHLVEHDIFIESQLASRKFTLGPCVVHIWSRNTLDYGVNETLVLHRVILWEKNISVKLSCNEFYDRFTNTNKDHSV